MMVPFHVSYDFKVASVRVVAFNIWNIDSLVLKKL